MKSTVALALAFVLVVSTVALALHTGVLGEISSIDPVARQIVVSDATVQVSGTTVIRMQSDVIGFEDLQSGMLVKAVGDMSGDILMATRLTVRVGDCVQ